MLIFKGFQKAPRLGDQTKMLSKSNPPEIPLPKSWGTHVKSATIHVLALAQYALTYSRSWAADSSNQRVRLKAENDRLIQEVALLREEIRIKDVRMAQIDPQRRPHYPSTERMAILELRAARGWSLEQAAKVFLVTADTIGSWVRANRRGRTERPGPRHFAGQQVPRLHPLPCSAVEGTLPLLGKAKDRPSSRPSGIRHCEISRASIDSLPNRYIPAT